MDGLGRVEKQDPRGEGCDKAYVGEVGRAVNECRQTTPANRLPATDYGQELRGKLLLRRDALRKELSEISQCLHFLDSDENVQRVFAVISVANR